LSLLVAAALIASIGAHRAESVENANLALGGVVGNLDDLDLGLGVLEGHDSAVVGLGGSGGFDSLGGSIGDHTLLGLVLLAREEDHLALVLLETVNVEVVLFLARAGASVVDGDSDGAGEGGGEASALKLSKGESAAKTNFASVAAGSRGNNRAQRLDGTGEHLRSLLITLNTTSVLLGGLIEVRRDAIDPVLAEMNVRNCVVVLDHC